ncbi:MAG: hypothetical protein N4A48_09130 [Tepidibacter sp.]|jgi:hypothetical protein|uniref:hypothetical protein n=1 Tax=Tepidibacter sp. TaxID=2529387 RepID=UPI0025EDEE45|nr:hypothetical protein [Tepidibacter sp.]MCT4508909.1 hypothetical protein [Tepidibacter sp.]
MYLKRYAAFLLTIALFLSSMTISLAISDEKKMVYYTTPNVAEVVGEKEEVVTEKNEETSIIENNKLRATIKMDYEGKSFLYNQGETNKNTDKEIYKTTKITWTSSLAQKDNIVEEEWINKKETYDLYGEQIVKLRVKDNSGKWSEWTEVRFNITNRAPVAQLKYMILNPESTTDGKITTDTQISWLWLYKNQSFVYDPDGDEITNIDVSGINEDDIIQTLDGGTEFQGFATQFKSPGRYTLGFKIQDKQGLWSNVWSINIEVESSVPKKEITISNVKSEETPNGTFKFAYASKYPNIVLSKFMPSGINNYLDYYVQTNEYSSDRSGSILETRWINEEKSREKVRETVAIAPQVGPKFNYQTYTLFPSKWDAVKVTGQKELEIVKPLVKGGFTIEGTATPQGKTVTATLFYRGNRLNDVNVLTDKDGNYKFTIDISGIKGKNTKYIYLSGYDTYYYDELDVHISCEGQEQTKTVLMETDVTKGLHIIGGDLIRKPGYSQNLGQTRPYDYWTSYLHWKYCQKYGHLSFNPMGWY